MRDAKGFVEISMLVEKGGALLAAREYPLGESTYVEGQAGLRYVVRIRNLTSERIEAVLTVDGLDARSGKDGSFANRGMLVPALATYDFEGFRLNDAEVAAFRFGAAGASYAAQMGKPRNVGVIGVAVFQQARTLAAAPPLAANVVPRSPSVSPPPDRPVPSGPVAPTGPRPPLPAGGRPSFSAPAPAGAPPALSRPAAPPSVSPSPMPAPSGPVAALPSPGAPLGTSFGERRASKISIQPFDRVSQAPDAVLVLRYEARDALLSLGIALEAAADREPPSPFPAEGGGCAPPPGWKG